ncbi:MAG: glutamate--tRNA ligase [Chloroflexi bacterium]|nr:glutamate--tRNA ligase [Chloroflexota bacterium]
MKDKVRVRYAPSPTGYPHMGNIRSALFNWLFARHHGGSFIVRIEDTDRARLVEGATESILDSLKWLGMDWDEGPQAGGDYGPYFQSERKEFYRQAAEQLVSQGKAYYCYCTPKRLEEMRAEQTKNKLPPGYDKHCRELSGKDATICQTDGAGRVIRFKSPLEGKTSFTDLIRDEVTFENAKLDDFVILKSDGFPTYHLASIIDDNLMKISHVLRAEEWISSTPKHIQLYEAMGYDKPQFAHLPMLLGADRSKLSKRHGAVSLTDYRQQGYLPEAILNFLALLGWALDDKTEFFSQKELVKHFSLERVNKTAAIFNVEKLEWMNGVYIRNLKPDDLAARLIPVLERDLPATVKRPLDKDYVVRIAPLVQERIKTLNDVTELTDFLFLDKLDYGTDMLIGKKMDAAITRGALEAAQDKIEASVDFSEEGLENTLRPLAEELGLKAGQLFGALRGAFTGRKVTPPLFGIMLVLGKETCLKRIRTAINILG